MKEFFKTLRKDSVLRWGFWITMLFITLSFLAIGIAYTNLPPFIPLYNHMPWGYARLGRTYELFLLPILVAGITAINTFLGTRLLVKHTLLARFLFISMICIALFNFIFIVRLIFDTL